MKAPSSRDHCLLLICCQLVSTLWCWVIISFALFHGCFWCGNWDKCCSPAGNHHVMKFISTCKPKQKGKRFSFWPVISDRNVLRFRRYVLWWCTIDRICLVSVTSQILLFVKTSKLLISLWSYYQEKVEGFHTQGPSVLLSAAGACVCAFL